MWRTLCLALSLYIVVARARKNILHIIIDDLRPELPPYNGSKFYPGNVQNFIQAPNIEKLAQKSTVFTRAYCQYPLCSPSRSSFLTGRRPSSSGVLRNLQYFRDIHKHTVTLPQFFKLNGYAALGTGKVFHPLADEDTISYDEFSDVNSAMHDFYSDVGNTWKAVADDGHSRLNLPDEDIRDRAVEMIRRFAKGRFSKPNFYLTVGFMKPHLPWVAPKRFFDLYDVNDIILPGNKKAPEHMPSVAWPHSESCILQQLDTATASRIDGYFNLTIPDDLAATYQRGYYACISFIDSLVGDVLAALRDHGLEDETIVLLHGDHGYNLGENSAWGKRTQFETANHVPLMIHFPGLTSGRVANGFVELVDLFPTLVELADFSASDVPRCAEDNERLCHEGVSLAPVVKGTVEDTDSEAAFFVHYHHIKKPVKGFFLGESVITNEGRLTKWSSQPNEWGKPRYVLDEELYDHTDDKKETANVVQHEGHHHLLTRLRNKLKKK